MGFGGISDLAEELDELLAGGGGQGLEDVVDEAGAAVVDVVAPGFGTIAQFDEDDAAVVVGAGPDDDPFFDQTIG